MDNINYNLETDLRMYCKTLDGQLFEKQLYNPLTYLAKSICASNRITKQEIENGIVEDMVSHAATRLPEYYDETKGNAKAAVYVLMSQYLSNQRSYNNKQKRSSVKTLYIEDLEHSDDHICALVQVEIDELTLMKQTLLQHRNLFKRLKTKLHRKIANKIIEAIEFPERFSSNKQSFTTSIAKRCGVAPNAIYTVIGNMREIITSV